MKQKISISVDKKTLSLVEEKLRSSLFRNKSHLFEFAVRKLFEGGDKDV